MYLTLNNTKLQTSTPQKLLINYMKKQLLLAKQRERTHHGAQSLTVHSAQCAD